MNELIQDLAKKSTDDILGVKMLDQKKFAELIIQECMNVLRQEWYVENNKEPDNDPRSIAIHVGTKSGLIRASNAVAKHFGIEK